MYGAKSKPKPPMMKEVETKQDHKVDARHPKLKPDGSVHMSHSMMAGSSYHDDREGF